MFSSEAWLSNSSNFYNGVATQSLRFDDGSSAYLSRTPSSAGNRQIWTISFWIKRSTISTIQGLFSTYNGTAGINTQSSFRTDNKLDFYDNDGSYQWNLVTTQVFRDTSAWYHLVYAVDTTQATASDRVKLYVNGTQITAFDTATYPSLNFSGADWNNNVIQFIGKHNLYYFDGYIAEFNNIDGSQLTPTSFGEFKNGVWIAKEYTGSYGTNGFRLQFNQTGTGTASSSTIGADTSGNANHFSSSGIVASDCDMPDSPENNFPTWNTIAPDPTYGITTISEGNLKSLNSPANNKYSEITFRLDQTNKYYFEYYNITTTGALQPASFELFASSSNKVGFYIAEAGYITLDGATIGTGFPTLSAGDIVNIAFDGASGKVWFGKNGTYYNASGSVTGNPADGTNPIATVTPAEFKMSSVFYQQGAIMNFGQDSTFAGGTTAGGNADANGKGDFKYSVPSGYLALCTANLPEPTISPNADTQADDYFNTVLYTGNSSTQSITGVGFQPDWVWIKARNQTYSHRLIDSIRGVDKGLRSDDTSAETTVSGALTSFDSDGFSLGFGTSETNNSAGNYVSWNWKAGGTAVSNTDGSITSSVSANTDAGFSIVTYTGTGSSATVGHSLSSTPNIMIIKNRDTTSSWMFWCDSFNGNDLLLLDSAIAKLTDSSVFNGTVPSSSVFSVGTNYQSNGSSANMIAYCFAEIEGYSKFGSYTGNGVTSGEGVFAYLGFRPAFIIIKNSSASSDWVMVDSVRSTFNEVDVILAPDNSGSESDFGTTNRNIDFLSNGFKIRSTALGGTTALNTSGNTYVYMAFAENPFKYANAR